MNSELSALFKGQERHRELPWHCLKFKANPAFLQLPLEDILSQLTVGLRSRLHKHHLSHMVGMFTVCENLNFILPDSIVKVVLLSEWEYDNEIFHHWITTVLQKFVSLMQAPQTREELSILISGVLLGFWKEKSKLYISVTRNQQMSWQMLTPCADITQLPGC